MVTSGSENKYVHREPRNCLVITSLTLRVICGVVVVVVGINVMHETRTISYIKLHFRNDLLVCAPAETLWLKKLLEYSLVNHARKLITKSDLYVGKFGTLLQCDWADSFKFNNTHL